MSKESEFWNYLRPIMQSYWTAQRHEDRTGASGIPDVSWGAFGIDGWLELKQIAALPAKSTTPINFGLRIDQVNWLKARGKAGSGRCYMLAKIGKGSQAIYILFHYADLPYPPAPLEETMHKAVWSSVGKVDGENLVNVLCMTARGLATQQIRHRSFIQTGTGPRNLKVAPPLRHKSTLGFSE